jgi:hypothetical protein
MKPPIFVWEGQDLSAFASAELAVGWLETLDDDLVIFDSEGKPLRLEVASQDRRWPGYTMALREKAEPRNEASLRLALMRALEVSDAAEETPLAELVEQASERFETRNPSGADLLRLFVPGFLRRKRN